MAHFLEHLVFKGGEKYATYRDVNQAAESIGAVLNAYTSHDLVAFHITSRAERALEAADLLTDFVARPRIDADELERERGVVVQEIARANDQPAVMAEHLIDEAVFGNHPLGRPGARVRGAHPRPVHSRGDRRRSATGAGRRPTAARSSSATSIRSTATAQLEELFERFPARPEPGPFEPAPPTESPRARARARLQPVAPADVLPAPGPRSPTPRDRAALQIYSTLLGGSMASRLFDEIREQRGLAYSVHSTAHAYADVPVLQLSAGLDSTQGDRGVRPDEGDRHRAARAGPDGRRRSSAPARTRPAPGRSRSRTAAPSPVTRLSRRSCTARTSIPTGRSTLIDEVPFERVVEVAAAVPEELSVACVGPQTAEEFESA